MTRKCCEICGFARPEEEPVCQVCGQVHFGESVEEVDLALGFRLAASNRWGDAYACFEDELVRDPDNAGHCRALAWLAYVVRDFRAVETWSHEASRLTPDVAGPYVLMALVFHNSGRWEECFEEAQAGLRRKAIGPAEKGLLSTLRDEARSRLPEHY